MLRHRTRVLVLRIFNFRRSLLYKVKKSGDCSAGILPALCMVLHNQEMILIYAKKFGIAESEYEASKSPLFFFVTLRLPCTEALRASPSETLRVSVSSLERGTQSLMGETPKTALSHRSTSNA